MSGIPQGMVLELVLFNICVSNTDSGTEHILSKSADDTKLCHSLNMMEGMDATQREQMPSRGKG